MPKYKNTEENDAIAKAALRLAAQGWDKVTLDQIAKAAKVSPSCLRQKCANTAALAPLMAAEIDREAFAAQKFTGAAHDILFDVLMARFDIMQKHRRAIISMAEAARHDRRLAYALSCTTIDCTYRSIDAAKISAPSRPILAVGIAAIYGWAFFVWQRDASPDMAKTMAALDRGLRLAGKTMAIIVPKI